MKKAAQMFVIMACTACLLPVLAEEVREVLRTLNRELAAQDMFSIELYDEMLGHIADFRAEQAAATEEVSE